MGLLEKKQEEQLAQIFAHLKAEVRIIYFTQSEDCEHCRIGVDLVNVLPPLSDKIKIEVHDVVAEPDFAKSYGVNNFPGIAVIGAKDYGLRFYGIPAGHEFTAFIQTILFVSAGDPALSPKVLDEVKRIDRPVHLQVMTSLTCPYCPIAVKSAQRLAMANDNIRADAIDTAEFPVMSAYYKVAGVPDTIINEKARVVGAMPELELTYFIQEALGMELSDEGKSVLTAVRLQIIEAQQHEHEHDHVHEHDHEYQPKPAAESSPDKPSPGRTKKKWRSERSKK